jgi:hypothetical protein
MRKTAEKRGESRKKETNVEKTLLLSHVTVNRLDSLHFSVFRCKREEKNIKEKESREARDKNIEGEERQRI